MESKNKEESIKLEEESTQIEEKSTSLKEETHGVSYYKNDFELEVLSSKFDSFLASQVAPSGSKKSTVHPIAPADSWERFYTWHKTKFFKVSLSISLQLPIYELLKGNRTVVIFPKSFQSFKDSSKPSLLSMEFFWNVVVGLETQSSRSSMSFPFSKKPMHLTAAQPSSKC